ncbi:hypothetical protein K458DRAFT_243789, partial [Lentithecium fluviatile CBS 122367]
SPHMLSSHSSRRFSRSYNNQAGSHPYRVEKPRSIHNSPHTVERRKTTTGAKLYATLDDHYNMMMGITGDGAAMENRPEPASTRPMSWHPSSAHIQVPRSAAYEQHEPQDYSRHYPESSRNSAHGSDFYSMSARNSMYMEPLQNNATYPHGYEGHRGSQDSDDSWNTQAYTQSSYSTPATEPMPWYLQEWARKNQVQSQHGSADFLPIQHPATQQETHTPDEEMEDSGKELVGMGLYDIPDLSLEWDSAQVEPTGKGLKLEETWQPPEEDDNEEDDDDEEEGNGDDSSSEDGEDELPMPPPAKQAAEQLQAPVNMKPQTPSSMEGQSFFFEEDDNITKEWWYPQLRQPSLPVRDAGIGYGWL